MEEPTSILFLEENAKSELNIQQPLYIGNSHSKLIEAENKLNRVFEEYSGRIESFMLMLDMLKEGVLIINKNSELSYSNEAGNRFLNESSILPTNFLFFRTITTEEVVSLNTESSSLQVRINNFFWNGEACNIFVIEEVEQAKPQVINEKSQHLNEPFDTLMNYVRLITENEAMGHIEEAAQYAEQAHKTILDSEKLLNDVKAFIALSNYPIQSSPVSMHRIAGDVLKSMGPEIEEAQIEVSVSDLPETIGDKELIIKLLKHLISNALKFRNKARKAIIDIGHDKIDCQFVFCIRDNGIGISKKHHEEVFNMFSTLNDPTEYPGNGMGLAISKKIVELHQGKIWVESLPGHGSNFYFKLGAK